MAATKEFIDRPLRVSVPTLVSFENETFTVSDLTLDLSLGGLFLPTDRVCSLGTVGTLTFRGSQFEQPVKIEGRVVRVVSAAAETPGLAIEFLDTPEDLREKLSRLVGGGSVAESIRKSIREGGARLDQELRRRPVDQKLMLAINARPEEIRALILDGNPSVIIRLLECPRLTPPHVMQILRNRSLPTSVLSAVYRVLSVKPSEEARWLFVTHPNAMFSEVVAELKKLNSSSLRRLTRELNVREKVRMKAREFTGQSNNRR